MRGLLGNGLFQFAIGFCILELLAWSLSWTLHTIHPLYESTAYVGLETSRGGFGVPGNGSDGLDPVSRPLTEKLRAQLAMNESGHWFMHPTCYDIEFPVNLSEWFALVPQIRRQFAHRAELFDASLFRLTFRYEGLDRAQTRLKNALTTFRDTEFQARKERNRIAYEKGMKDVEKMRLSENMRLPEYVDAVNRYEREISIWKDYPPPFPLTIWEEPSPGKPVLFFHLLLTHVIVFMLTLLFYFASRASGHRNNAALIQALA